MIDYYFSLFVLNVRTYGKRILYLAIIIGAVFCGLRFIVDYIVLKRDYERQKERAEMAEEAFYYLLKR